MRLSLCALVALLLVFILSSSAYAASPARGVLEEGLTHVLDLIKSPDYSNAGKRGMQKEKIKAVVKKYFDFEEFSSRTVGARWKQFSDEEKKQFSEAFSDLLIYTYINKIDGYNGEQIQYGTERGNNDRVEIMTNVLMRDGKNVPVAYRMLPKNNTWMVYDVLIENISLVKNYRSQFQDILKSSNVSQLIDRIRVKADEARNKNGKK